MKQIKLLSFLQELEKRKIYFNLEKVRDSIMVAVTVPGQRWEIEFFDDGHIEIEKFVSIGTIFDEKEISVLFNEFSN